MGRWREVFCHSEAEWSVALLGCEVYMKYSLTLAPGATAPEGWPSGQAGTFPCRVESASIGGFRHREESCTYTGLQPAFEGKNPQFKTPSWKGDAPKHLVFCMLKSRNWGAPVATLTGDAVALRHPYRQNHQWWAKLELQRPIWCPSAAYEGPPWGAAITYSAIRLTLYGPGEDFRPGPNSWIAGHRQGRKHVAWQKIKPRPSNCLLGIEERNPEYNPRGVSF